MKKTLVGTALVLSAACSPQSQPTHQFTVPAQHLTPATRCSHTLDAYDWPAGDLCDTLQGAPGFGPRYPESKWSWDNRHIGWVRIDGTDCWDTRATTDDPYILCWDGSITKL